MGSEYYDEELPTKASSSSYTPAPEGVHQGVCVDVIDLGMKSVTYDNKTKEIRKIQLVWQLNARRDDGKRFTVQKHYNASLYYDPERNQKSNLREDVDAWLPGVTKGVENFRISSLLGKNCLLNVVHAHRGDRVYANVASIMPLVAGMKPMDAENYTRKKIGEVAQPKVEPEAVEEEGEDDNGKPKDADIPF